VGSGAASWAGPRCGLAERRAGQAGRAGHVGRAGCAGGEREDGVDWAALVGPGWPAGLKV
jgi:hypothetical protein